MPVIQVTTLATALGLPGSAVVDATITCIPWAGSRPYVRVEGAEVDFPRHVVVRVVAGSPVEVFELVPSGPTWCWRIVVQYGQQRLERFVVVPDVPEVEFGALVQVDPTTLVPTPDTVAGWDAALAGFEAGQVAQDAAIAGKADEAALDALAGVVAGKADTAALDALADSLPPVGGGVRWVPLGDSLTSIEGGGPPYMGWTVQAEILSQGRIRALVNAGVEGNNAAQGLARVQAVLAHQPTLVTVWFGTNDITQGRTLAAYQSDMTAIIDALTAAGVTLCLFTIPPRADTSKIAQTGVWNQWLRDLARDRSLHLIDTYDALVNRATGTYAAGADWGDGIHISQAGHNTVAAAFTEAMLPRVVVSEPLAPRTNADPNNLLANGLLLAGGGAVPDSWTATGGPLTGFTEAWVNDPDFVGGKAWEVAAVTPTSFRQFNQLAPPADWDVGDELFFVARIKVISATGVPTGLGLNINCNLYGSSGVNPAATGVSMPGLSGLVSRRLTVLPGTTDVQLDCVFNPSAAASATYRVGDLGIFNLTRMGIA